VKWVFENIADNQGGIFGLFAEKGSAKKDLPVGLRQRNFPIREADWLEGTFSYRQERLLREPEEATEGQWRQQRKQSLTKMSKS
jgi:hypothetical protein